MLFEVGTQVERVGARGSYTGGEIGDRLWVVRSDSDRLNLSYTKGGQAVEGTRMHSKYNYHPDNFKAVPCPASTVDKQDPLDTQVGGGHYKDSPRGYQPFEISKALGLNPVEHTAMKYLLRHKNKHGKQDLEKAKHCLDILIAQEYPNA